MGNNTNIVHVNAIQGLLDEVVKHLKELRPDKSDANIFSEQTIAKESALRWLEILVQGDIDKCKQAFE